jgi:hypothetical protein
MSCFHFSTLYFRSCNFSADGLGNPISGLYLPISNDNPWKHLIPSLGKIFFCLSHFSQEYCQQTS